MSRLFASAVAAIVVVSACATQGSEHEFGELSAPPATWSMAALDTSPLHAGWLAAIDDTHLTALVAEALEANPDLGAARGRLNRARAILSQTRAAQAPSIRASSSGSVTEGFAGGSATPSYSAAITASWEADLWGRLASATEADKRAAASAEADFQAAQQLIAASTAQAYFLLIEARQLADVERTNLESLEETLGFVSIQFERGLRSSEDIALIRADVETARAGLDLAEQTKRNAARAIETLVGRYPAASLEVRASSPARPAHSPVGLPADVLQRRPDVRAAKLSLLAEHTRTKSARADLLPRLSAQASFSGENSALEDLFDPSALAANLLLNGAQTLFDSGARQARIAAADADREIALASYQSLVLTAFNEVEAELDRGEVLTRRAVFLTRALSEAQDALRFSRFRYELGESDLLNVLSIQQRVASLRAALARTERARLDQYVALALALGQDV